MIRKIPPPPPEFREVFERGGWELAELLYGARTDLIRKWVILTGATARRPKSTTLPTIKGNQDARTGR